MNAEALQQKLIHERLVGRHDPVNRPKHYTSHPSGVECIQITEHMGFNLGNVIKYLWRAEEKGAPLEDLKKAAWYLQREIQKRAREEANQSLLSAQVRGEMLTATSQRSVADGDRGE